MALLLSDKFVTVGAEMAQHGVTRLKPTSQKAVALRPEPQAAKNLKPRPGSATEVP